MIIVPVLNDSVKTKDGLPYKVLSFTNYNTSGPAVIVQGPSSTETVFFDDITELAGRKVTLLKSDEGYKVFESDGFVERKFHLPQIGEIVKSSISGIESRKYEVQRIRLHVKGSLAKGMIFDVQDKDSNEVKQITLDDIEDIEHYLFERQKFLTFYADYRPKGVK